MPAGAALAKSASWQSNPDPHPAFPRILGAPRRGPFGEPWRIGHSNHESAPRVFKRLPQLYPHSVDFRPSWANVGAESPGGLVTVTYPIIFSPGD